MHQFVSQCSHSQVCCYIIHRTDSTRSNFMEHDCISSRNPATLFSSSQSESADVVYCIVHVHVVCAMHQFKFQCSQVCCCITPHADSTRSNFMEHDCTSSRNPATLSSSSHVSRERIRCNSQLANAVCDLEIDTFSGNHQYSTPPPPQPLTMQVLPNPTTPVSHLTIGSHSHLSLLRRT